MNTFLGKARNHFLPEFAQGDTVAGNVRILFQDSQDVAFRRVRIKSEQQVWRRQMEEAERMDCTNWPQCKSSRSSAAVSGMRTLMMASQAFDDASRWLTGQIPQMRAVIDGIS